MITYNHEKFIADAIESILMQKTNYDYEIVIGEDCSSDNTKNILLEYKKKYPGKFNLILHEKNVGAIQNQIDTFSACQGKYIALLEGDDYWTDPYKLQKQVTFLETNPDYNVCFSNIQEVNNEGIISAATFNYKKIPETYSFRDIAEFNFIPSPTVMYRNHVISEMPFWLSKAPFGDYILHLLFSHESKIFYMPETMAVYRRHAGGVWTQIANHVQATKLKWVVDKMDEYFKYKYHDSFYSKKFLEDYYLSLMEHYKEQRNALKYFSHLAGFAKHKKKLQRSFGNLFLLAKQYFSHKITTS